ncbi:hypothetical protein H1D32_11320 [Anaerobacillus sp. CMMVII]|uniref:hypothetical protein n=1 Tax=Anaerobacillus sp. CMMVII TaxID=2755588 RepID=UPI0021B7774E|nr:hypothetical protein [Anaerobacillus sp. CMMVII]MCT8138288.1 hypothetical protein [Anaerobacillus sp. CMMVII]
MTVSRTYTDYTNKIAITIPDSFIDVKTGNNLKVSAKIQEQIEYHAKNNSLHHYVFSALHDYMKPKVINSSQNELILQELSTIRKLVEKGDLGSSHPKTNQSKRINKRSQLEMNEVEDVLDAFGG